MAKLEGGYQESLVKKIQKIFPKAIIMKNDPTYIQGIPDLTILEGNKWAVLEVKKSSDEPYQPNQEYYLEITDKMSFSATIFPENEKEVLDGLQRSFKPKRNPRTSKRK